MARVEVLRRDVGLTGVVMLGAGTAVGVSIFSVLQPAAQLSGSGLLTAIAISVVPMSLFAFVYGWMASVHPVSGASYEWPRRFLGPATGFAIAWLRILANVGALVLFARVFAGYIAIVVGVPVGIVAGAAMTLVFAINLLGVAIAARVQTAAMAVLIAVLAAFVVAGATEVEGARFGSLWPPGTIATVPLMISLFFGIEAAVEIGEEVRDPRRTIPIGIVLSVSLAAIIYAAVAATALGLVGPAALAGSPAPLLEAARVPFGDWAAPVVIVTATVSILKTMNATVLIFSRSLFAMARSGALPSALAAVHPRFATPHRALAAGYALAIAGLLLPSGLIFLLLAINLPTMAKYGACSLCAVRVAHGAGHRRVALAGCMAMAGAVAIVLAGFHADARPYALALAWLAIGAFVYLTYARRRMARAAMETPS